MDINIAQTILDALVQTAYAASEAADAVHGAAASADSHALVTTSKEIPHVEDGDILGSFGINWKLFIAHVINFAIVLGVLWFFAYKPLMKLMSDRTKKIEEGVKRADEMDARVKELEQERETVLAEARSEAKRVVEEAEVSAKKQGDEIVEKAKADVDAAIATSKKQIEAQKEQMMQEAKAELTDIVIKAAEVVAKGAIDSTKATDGASSAIESALKDV